MTWFKVDDKAHANTKIRNVLATCPAALSLWTVAGSWVADELNDGFVPDSQLPWLMPAGAEELAQALVAARLWRRVRGGYQFHEWHKDSDGTKRNPTREEVLAERQRKAEAGRKGGLASGKTRSKPEARASAPAKQVLDGSLNPRPVPSRPSPSYEGERASAEPGHPPSGEPPPPKCDEHIDDPDPPNCGRCADARRARDAWDREQLRATTLRRQAEAKARAESHRLAIDACHRCDHEGKIAGRPCPHTDPPARPRTAGRIGGLTRERADPVARARQRAEPNALDAAVAELPPLAHPPPADDGPETLAEVVPIKPTPEAADVPR